MPLKIALLIHSYLLHIPTRFAPHFAFFIIGRYVGKYEAIQNTITSGAFKIRSHINSRLYISLLDWIYQYIKKKKNYQLKDLNVRVNQFEELSLRET